MKIIMFMEQLKLAMEFKRRYVTLTIGKYICDFDFCRFSVGRSGMTAVKEVLVRTEGEMS